MNAVDEIVEHHRFIESWLRGTAAGVAGFLDMHAPDFTWYDPDGSLHAQPDLAAAMDAAHGSVPDLRLRIREPRVLLDADGLIVATYEEHHQTELRHEARRAVAILVPDPFARHGLRWRHLHETWIATP
ncbi:DUF4440 domain-containing protein [Spirillospora sp. NPDC029432]|uniref:nuclear transport factor 2 family protein n=1 Tax=Spirillospora sp. NPDC029432 TaxID=3154599 RepID=UPI003453B408